MHEKERALLSDDCGRDLASVQALQRKHEGLERELAALEDKVGDLGEEARRLQGKHSDSADRIAAKQAEIVGLWEAIKRKVRESVLQGQGDTSLVYTMIGFSARSQTGRCGAISKIPGRLSVNLMW